jgi:preprotein translocase YajC subunit
MQNILSVLPTWAWIFISLVIIAAAYSGWTVFNYNRVRSALLKFQNSLQVKDKIVLNSGIHGTIQKINKEDAMIEIANNVLITVDRLAIHRKITYTK